MDHHEQAASALVAPAELPVVDLQAPIQPGLHVGRAGQHGLHGGAVSSLHQQRAAHPPGAVVRQQGTVQDEPVAVAGLAEPAPLRPLQGLAGRRHARLAVADDQEAPVIARLGGGVPHRAAERVAPAAHQHLAVHAGPVEGLLEGEHPRCLGIGQVHHVHAAGPGGAVRGQRRPPGDHGVGIAVHERPVGLGQLLQQRLGPRPATAVDEVLHDQVMLAPVAQGAPSKSPTTGMPAVCLRRPRAAPPPPSALRRYQCLPDRSTPGVIEPSPSQSPANGWSPARPNRNGVRSGPGPLPSRRCQTPPRNSPGVKLRSPSQSPTTKRSPRRPKRNPGTLAGPLLLLSRSSHRPSLTTPGVQSPSPSQSPTTNLSPRRPNPKRWTTGLPGVTPPRRWNTLPRTTPSSWSPSPSQSPTKGTSPWRPKAARVKPRGRSWSTLRSLRVQVPREKPPVVVPPSEVARR